MGKRNGNFPDKIDRCHHTHYHHPVVVAAIREHGSSQALLRIAVYIEKAGVGQPPHAGFLIGRRELHIQLGFNGIAGAARGIGINPRYPACNTPIFRQQKRKGIFVGFAVAIKNYRMTFSTAYKLPSIFFVRVKT